VALQGPIPVEFGLVFPDSVYADMIRRLPAGFPLLIRGSHAPAIISAAKGWKYRGHRRLRRPESPGPSGNGYRGDGTAWWAER
jgi:hypothetical protein